MRDTSDTTAKSLRARYPAWLHVVCCLPGGDASHESRPRTPLTAAKEAWEDEGGALLGGKGGRKLPF